LFSFSSEADILLEIAVKKLDMKFKESPMKKSGEIKKSGTRKPQLPAYRF
jgi:hypothetical protein